MGQAAADRPIAAVRAEGAGAGGRAVGLWLLLCCAMIFLMAVIGAITRLTESGLSIMEWAPLSGALPPLSQAEWERLFALYQQIPEYQEENYGMSLAEFKTIFWWEYVHRLWGRLIGLVFLLPFLWFFFTRRLDRTQALHLGAIFLLGALQGALGWYMVASGFAERSDVSQYRLVAHLGMALLIYAYAFWVALGLLTSPGPAAGGAPGRLGPALITLLVLVTITILSGGFVAGLNAGMLYNEFPLMGEGLVPDDYRIEESFWRNAFEGPAAAQLHHRWLAVSTLAAAALVALYALPRLDPGRLRRVLALVLAWAAVQTALGIATLVLLVPVSLAAAHQGGAIVLLTLALWALFLYRRDCTHPARPGRF